MKLPAELPVSFTTSLRLHAVRLDDVDPATLAGGIVRLILEKLEDGVAYASVRGGYVHPGAAVLRAAPPGIRVPDLTVEAVRDICLRLLDTDYAASTVSKQHLGVIRQVQARAGERDTTQAARRRLGHLLKARSLPPPVFSADEMRHIFSRMSRYKSRHYLPARWRDIAVLRLAGYRAVRALELSRVRIERDVDLRARTLAVRQAKDSANPRLIDLSDILVEDVETLREGRDEGLLVRGGARAINAVVETWQKRLDEPRLSMRHLRRSCASALSEQGAPLAVIRDVLGHSRTSSATTRYLQTTRRRLRQELAALEHPGLPAESEATRASGGTPPA